jgi:hypothetical protein
MFLKIYDIIRIWDVDNSYICQLSIIHIFGKGEKAMANKAGP